MLTVDFRDWLKFHDDPNKPRVSPPLGHYYPSSRQDIIDIIKAAESSSDSPMEVRACGSHWSFSDSAVTNDFIVETHDPATPDEDAPRLNRTLTDVLPPCLSEDAKIFFRTQKMEPFDPNVKADHSKFYLYHVEAGVRIYELYSRLDAGDIGEDKSTSLATWLYNIGLREYDGPWAMETLGGAGGQTIVGAFSTGTHGGNVALPPIADAVQAIHLISNTLYPSLTKEPQPQEYWIERPLSASCPTLVSDALIEFTYPGIKVIRDSDIFRSVLVSAGRMGIIYSVVLRVVRQYALEEVQSKDEWSGVKKWLVADPKDPNFSRRFVQVVVNPNRHADDEDHSCWVTLRDLKALTDTNFPNYGRAERGLPSTAGNSYPLADPTSGTLTRTAGDFFNKMCASDSALRDFLNGMVATEEATRDAALVEAYAVALAIPFAVFGLAYLEAELAAALAVAALAQGLISIAKTLLDALAPGPFYNTLGTIANWAAENDEMEIFRRIADVAIGFELSDHAYTAISYAIMDVHNYLDVGCTGWGDSVEIFFDFSSQAAAENVVAFLDLIFEDNNAMNNGWLPVDDPTLSGKKMAFPGYVALRFMSESSAMIAMQKWPTVCSIEIAVPGPATGAEPFLTAVTKRAVSMGATLHWGQRNDLPMKEIERSFGDKPGEPLYRWRQTLSQFTHHGRQTTFSNPWCRKLGLEVVQPLLYSFTISMTEGCAGELTTAQWDAFDNPPGTVVNLEVLPTDSLLSPKSVITLPSLRGSQDIPLPLGSNVIKVVTSLEFNGRKLSDESVTANVRGFTTGDIWPFNLTTICQSVDGVFGFPRWSARLSFGSTISKRLAVDQITSTLPGITNPWFLRRAGIPDVQFTPATTVQALPGPQPLEGDWVFFTHDIGCMGTSPEVHVQFRIVCLP